MKNKDLIKDMYAGVVKYINEKYGANMPEARGVNKESLMLLDVSIDILNTNKEILELLKSKDEVVKKVVTPVKK